MSGTNEPVRRTVQIELARRGPLAKGERLVGEQCQGCTSRFRVGDLFTLVPIGPGDDPESQERARQGRYYIPMTVAVHWACATGERLTTVD